MSVRGRTEGSVRVAAADLSKPLGEVTLRVFRFSPDKDRRPYYKDYRVPVYRFTTVLDALLYIKYNVDPTLSVRYSCRMGVCGSCGMIINNLERLACSTTIASLGTGVVTVRPLNSLPVLKDLVCDFKGFFDKHRRVKPYVIRDDLEENVDREFLQWDEEMVEYVMFSDCIKCGLCYSACPTTATDELFLGPQALAQAYRYIADTRDAGALERLEAVDTPHGVWRCHFAGTCSYVCPKGVDPALAIQRLKSLLLFRRGRYLKRKPARESDKPREVLRELEYPPFDEWPRE